jgi:hypothetical protein
MKNTTITAAIALALHSTAVPGGAAMSPTMTSAGERPAPGCTGGRRAVPL